MIYLERIPAAPLRECVRMLWYARAADTPQRRERILPNGCVQVILNLARDYFLDCVEDTPDQQRPPSLVVGARRNYEIVDCSDMADLVGIVFEPGGFAAFSQDAVDVFSQRNISLEDVWGSKARGLRDRLREVVGPLEKLIALEEFLMGEFAPRLGRSAVVAFALERFSGAPAISTVEDVAQETGWSIRYFSQVFREQVGLSPKVWCRIQRFQRAVRLLHRGVDVRWAELALQCGYYDQSHFANDFRLFSGVDATTYSARRTLWANHIPVE